MKILAMRRLLIGLLFGVYGLQAIGQNNEPRVYVMGAAGGSLDTFARSFVKDLVAPGFVNGRIVAQKLYVVNQSYADVRAGLDSVESHAWNFLVAETFVSDGRASEMERIQALNRLKRVAYLYERYIEPNTGGNNTAHTTRIVGGLYARSNADPMWVERGQTYVASLVAQGFDFTNGGRFRVKFSQDTSGLQKATGELQALTHHVTAPSPPKPAVQNSPDDTKVFGGGKRL